MTPQEKQLNNALRFITIYLIQSKIEDMKAQIFSDGEFYVVEIKIRKIVE